MADFAEITEKLADNGQLDLEFIKDVGQKFAAKISKGEMEILDIIQGLDKILTNGDHNIRLKGIELLAQVIPSLPKDLLSEKKVEVLSEFVSLRLIDHKSMERPALRCLSYFVDCENKPARYNKGLLEFLKTKSNVQRLEPKSRLLVYNILKKIVLEKHQRGNHIDSDLIYSIIHLIEGESNPENLLVCFYIVSYIMKNFKDLEPFVDDLFEWLSSYFPIDYTPKDEDCHAGVNITKEDLVRSLYDCFYASELNASNLQTLLLEKLETNLVSTKLESLSCLIKCYELFPLSSVKDFASSLWTAIRMDCLRKVNTVDKKLLEANYKALSSMTSKLSEDDTLYVRFIGDMYEELAIAIRKPEMELFESATQLLCSAVQPKLLGFNYILNRMLPISMNAISANELRPISGLSYIFEQLSLHHKGTKLNVGIIELLNDLVLKVSEFVQTNSDSLKLIKAIANYNVDLKPATLDTLIANLMTSVSKSSLDLEECLAYICLNYKRSDILFNEPDKECHISSLIKLVEFYEKSNLDSIVLAKFSIYLRQLIILFDTISSQDIDSLNQHDLNAFLSRTRNIIISSTNSRITEHVCRLHAILINKLDNKALQPILMDIFSSNYCQELALENSELKLSLVKWVLLSLVVRNHQLGLPLINLVLNFITSSDVNEESALLGSRVFDFVQSNEDLLNKEKHYQVFALYKQKFYVQVSKEVQIRYAKEADSSKRHLLICALALQVPRNLPASVYKKDYDWLIRELLKILTSFKDKIKDKEQKVNEDLILVSYGCIESLIIKNPTDNLSSFLGSLVDMNLAYAQEAKTLQLRKRALVCLAGIASSFEESDLLILRSQVVHQLKNCLSDKKRLVREAASEARSRWIMIGQPIGA